MNFIWLESSDNVGANHAIGLEFWKGFVWILIKGNRMPIMQYLAKQLFGAIYISEKL